MVVYNPKNKINLRHDWINIFELIYSLLQWHWLVNYTILSLILWLQYWCRFGIQKIILCLKEYTKFKWRTSTRKCISHITLYVFDYAESVGDCVEISILNTFVTQLPQYLLGPVIESAKIYTRLEESKNLTK